MSNMSLYKQFEFIEKDVKEMCKSITQNLAKTARSDMAKSARLILEDYYNTYTPHEYSRNHNLYNMILLKSNKTRPDGYVATVQTSADSMLNVYKNNKYKPFIYDLVWNAAHRGLPTQMNMELIDPELYKGWTWHPKFTDEYGDTYHAVTPHFLMINYMDAWVNNGRKHLDKLVKHYYKSVIL